MKRKSRSLWRWCLVLAILVNTIAPVWAGAAMATELLQVALQTPGGAESEAGEHAQHSPAVAEAGRACETAGQGADHGDCTCDATGTCTCPCTLSLKMVDMRVRFAARHLLSSAPVSAAWDSAERGPPASLLRPPIA